MNVAGIDVDGADREEAALTLLSDMEAALELVHGFARSQRYPHELLLISIVVADLLARLKALS